MALLSISSFWKIWTHETLYETRVVDSHIRRKLKETGVSPELIETVRYIGYRFTDVEDAPV
ncbi:MAG TPA: helix-turn-helix domain-containing protein [Bacillota bacterium]